MSKTYAEGMHGREVAKGDVIFSLEAIKMQMNVTAEWPRSIEDHYTKGDEQVNARGLLAEISVKRGVIHI